ncbi:hypothetical protein Fmac_018208 [Flemingia macrophylla]|uniref:Uncharacterized protein n=1 Tax=Flemingia macrophylla TaxID=520843 RepID=A0ABD1M4A4_9FABA
MGGFDANRTAEHGHSEVVVEGDCRPLSETLNKAWKTYERKMKSIPEDSN